LEANLKGLVKKYLASVNGMKKAEVSKIILEKIETSDAEKSVKSLVKRILEWEIEHFDEAKPRYHDEFTRMIENIAAGGSE
jgi:hypothetical protein